jgi:hypothetical protein
MHAINLFRFRHQPDQLGMWRSARSLRLSSRRGGVAAESDELPSVASLTAAAALAQRALPPGGDGTGPAT